MRLLTSGASPFGRKVKVVAHETGLTARIEAVESPLTPVAANADVTAANPLGKIPCLVLDDGTAVFDSRVICEHLDGLHEGRRLFPAGGPERLRALTLQALADGVMDAAVAARYETFLRPEPHRWPDWVAGQKGKVDRALDRLEAEAPALAAGPVTIGTLAVGCALGYLDFRFAGDAWREGRPRLAAWHATVRERESFRRTEPA